jgi:hypothetical protein
MQALLKLCAETISVSAFSFFANWQIGTFVPIGLHG